MCKLGPRADSPVESPEKISICGMCKIATVCTSGTNCEIGGGCGFGSGYGIGGVDEVTVGKSLRDYSADRMTRNGTNCATATNCEIGETLSPI